MHLRIVAARREELPREVPADLERLVATHAYPLLYAATSRMNPSRRSRVQRGNEESIESAPISRAHRTRSIVPTRPTCTLSPRAWAHSIQPAAVSSFHSREPPTNSPTIDGGSASRSAGVIPSWT